MTLLSEDLEQGGALTPRYNEQGLIPAIAQDARTGAVLMLAWMNAEALEATVASGAATYWSRSRKALWRKGETSGHTQRVVEILIDCDQDTILLKVEHAGPACHTGAQTCFYRAVRPDNALDRVEPSPNR